MRARTSKATPLVLIATLVLACTAPTAARAEEFKPFDSKGLPGSQGLSVRVSHPPGWKKVVIDDEMAVAELRGPQGKLTGILQIGRGRQRNDIHLSCQPERARTMLQGLAAQDPMARVTDVVARQHEGRPAYEIRYERHDAPTFMVVRSLIVCLKNSKLVVSCGGAGEVKAALAAIEPVCRQVLESLAISEE